MSFLAIDIGNTRLKWTLYDAPRVGATLLAHGAIFLENIDRLAESDWRSLPVPARMLGCNVAGEAVRHRVEEQLELWDLQPSWVHSSAQEGDLVNGYDHPTRLGADRWVAMIGARQRMLDATRGQAVRPLILVMVGTAVTVEAIDADGRFLGGLILPGHGMMLRALESGTAGLRVPTGDVVPFPTNTSDALTSGGTYAIAGAVQCMTAHLRQHSRAEPLLYMTGGAGWKMLPHLQGQFDLVESLVFDGLLAVAQRRYGGLVTVP
ncbi:MAG: type III pantothenate kinase [Comamonas sp.]